MLDCFFCCCLCIIEQLPLCQRTCASLLSEAGVACLFIYLKALSVPLFFLPLQLASQTHPGRIAERLAHERGFSTKMAKSPELAFQWHKWEPPLKKKHAETSRWVAAAHGFGASREGEGGGGAIFSDWCCDPKGFILIRRDANSELDDFFPPLSPTVANGEWSDDSDFNVRSPILAPWGKGKKQTNPTVPLFFAFRCEERR